MKFPIIIDDHGDVSIYDSVEAAQLDLEAVDVKNHQFKAYDGDGQLLALEVVSKRFGSELVRVTDPERMNLTRDVLRDVLENYLVNCECVSSEQLSALDDTELLKKVRRWSD
jgi:hypothetical protein